MEGMKIDYTIDLGALSSLLETGAEAEDAATEVEESTEPVEVQAAAEQGEAVSGTSVEPAVGLEARLADVIAENAALRERVKLQEETFNSYRASRDKWARKITDAVNEMASTVQSLEGLARGVNRRQRAIGASMGP
ncbi:hypothetical protein Pan216_11600 [Planctomycetes bacterium Pan216]|uniref:Uncharacterized protein n=1 Tax=Kolteria novifilia TaxID=2527975 RepID=A0A518B027_9BACT|nr:hypothetical protein Pan216_11600 [Planctomycetes bacterium Pan216]